MATMREAQVVEFPREIALDDVRSVLNPVRCGDLRAVMSYTPARLRVVVALAFAELTLHTLAECSGLPYPAVRRWVAAEYRMPFGAAIRLARVFGVPADEIFEEYL